MQVFNNNGKRLTRNFFLNIIVKFYEHLLFANSLNFKFEKFD